MNRLLILVIYFPLLTNAQNGNGIKWTDSLTWQQLKTKAKQENKYIFLDCYTTWCGPCKAMDNYVYVNDSVGDYFNQHFLSVKVQMDKTQKDNEQVKSWYADASTIEKQYHVESYPTYIFLSPEGRIVHKDIGYKGVNDFIVIAQTALSPGKVYNDPYKEYDKLVEEYTKGITNYDSLPFLISSATNVNDTALQRELLRLHVDYMCSLPPEHRYTKENIRFWSFYSLGSKTRLFGFFYKDGKKIDKVMNEKGYSQRVVDRTIIDEVVTPFLQEEAAGSGIAVTGGYLTDISGQNMLKTDCSEANWKKLFRCVKEKFNRDFAKRNVLSAKVEWYTRHWNYVAAAKHSLIQLNKYPPNLKIPGVSDRINNVAFEAFRYSTDTKVLKGYLKWMEKVIAQRSDIAHWIDTYANLLYKIGRKQEAIKWEEKAVQFAPQDKGFQETLEKMKLGEPTCDAVWKNQ